MARSTGTNRRGGLRSNRPPSQRESPGFRGRILQPLDPVGQIAEEIVERLNRSSQVPGTRCYRVRQVDGDCGSVQHQAEDEHQEDGPEAERPAAAREVGVSSHSQYTGSSEPRLTLAMITEGTW